MTQPTPRPGPTPSASYNSPPEDLRKKIVAAAIDTATSAADTDYTPGGKTLAGFDCSGFVYYVLHQIFPEFKYMTTEDIVASKLFSEVTAYRPADLIFFPLGTVPFEARRKNSKIFPNHVG